jgi:hypothetical protein
MQQTITINNDSFELNNLWKNHETNRNNKATLTWWRKSLNLETCKSQQICKQRSKTSTTNLIHKHKPTTTLVSISGPHRRWVNQVAATIAAKRTRTPIRWIPYWRSNTHHQKQTTWSIRQLQTLVVFTATPKGVWGLWWREDITHHHC